MRRMRQTCCLLPGYQRTQAKVAPRLWIRMSVPVAIIGVLIATVAFGLPRMQSHAAANKVNGNCTLIVPANPLTAQGLTTPYQLVATNPAKGQCNEANKTQAAFVQGAVIDPTTGAISIYNPLVIDQGTQPAAQPVTTTLLQGGIVALWFGFNGTNLRLQDSNGSLQAGQCVNGIAIDGTINGVMNGGQGKGTGTTPNCVINGTTVVGCTGSTTIGTQTCTFAFDTNADQVNITCPKGVVPAQ